VATALLLLKAFEKVAVAVLPLLAAAVPVPSARARPVLLRLLPDLSVVCVFVMVFVRALLSVSVFVVELVAVLVLLSWTADEASLAVGPVLFVWVDSAVALCTIEPADPSLVFVGLDQTELEPNASAMAPASTVLFMWCMLNSLARWMKSNRRIGAARQPDAVDARSVPGPPVHAKYLSTKRNFLSAPQAGDA